MINLFSQSNSIGIIGGADGPTAIMVASYNPWVYVIATVAVVAVIVAAAIIVKKRCKK